MAALLVALTPTTVYIMSVVEPNGLETSLGLERS